jgi:cobalt/nickel transport system permease protein
MLYSPKPMHVPDGFLSVPVAITLWVIAIIAVASALRQSSRALDERRVPLMGVLAAAIFAGQMLNFAVAGGTSGHLMGAALATILLGPAAATLVLTAVVGVQALVFQDGGLLALGGNITNMAVIGVAVAFIVYGAVSRIAAEKRWGILAGGFVAGWASVFVASLAVAIELALSGTSPANIAVPAMGGIHAIIGIGEGLITAGALAFILATRPDLLDAGTRPSAGTRPVWIAGIAVAFGLAVLAPLASVKPDGLEWVAEQTGFLDRARGPLFSILPDYSVPGVENSAISTIVAGLAGVLLVLGVAYLVGTARRRRRTET